MRNCNAKGVEVFGVVRKTERDSTICCSERSLTSGGVGVHGALARPFNHPAKPPFQFLRKSGSYPKISTFFSSIDPSAYNAIPARF